MASVVREENWAISAQRIRVFFRQQADVSETETGFVFRQCSIRLTPLSGQLLGKWQQPRTLITLEGPEADTEEIYKRFFLRFLSAGG